MTCEEYRVLLDDFLDGVIRPEDEEKMLRHEAECPACKELRASLSALQSDLSDLSEDVPPLPEDFHAQWTEKVAALSTEEKPKVKDKNAALTLYYADEGENLWNISEKYCTSVEAIQIKNELTDDIIQAHSMILIPM